MQQPYCTTNELTEKPVLVMSELGNKRSEKKANFPAFLSGWAKLG
jgi:hypothetical protein